MGATTMKTIRLGSQGAQVPQLGLGCMRMSDPPPARDDAESVATIIAALDAGVRFLNTGDFYAHGHNEALVARALQGRRDDAFLSVKFGGLRAASGQFLGIDVRPAAVKNFAAYSLQRLGVDVIDLYQPGRLDPAVPVEDTVGAVAELIAEGKVRYLGLSEVTAAQLRAAHREYPVTALEIEYSLATRFIEPEILPAARELGIGIVAYGITGHGLLAGTTPPESMRRSPRLHPDNLDKNLETAAALQVVARRKNCSPAQIALAWVLAQGDDILALIGMSRRTRIPENLAAVDITLTDADLAELDHTFALGAFAGDRLPPEMLHNSAH
jgi:aryl-alcohol dehydrogenase-like predicted oxidoreductase